MTTFRDTVGEIHTYNIDVKNREIYINEFDDSGESAGVDHRMLQNFIKNINILKNLSKDPITIHMQTVGGCWYSGMGIYDAIKNCKCQDHFYWLWSVMLYGYCYYTSCNKTISY